MLQFILRQILMGLTTLFLVITLTFVLLRFLPGGPFDQDRKLPPDIQANINAQYHLDKPIATQYSYYLTQLLKGDLGPSYKYKTRRVNDIVSEATHVSVTIGFLALTLGLSMGVLLGTLAGITAKSWQDGLFALLGMSAISMPSFIVGGSLVLLFALTLKILPAATLSSPLHYVLPVLTLSLVPFAYSFMLIRTSVKEVLTQPYVHIKRSMGLGQTQITISHVLRNSLIPLISVLGPIAAAIVTGSFAVEYIFAVPGLGKHFITAVGNRDYTLVMGITILYSVLLIVFNTLTDLIYGWLDPRFRDQAKGAA